MSELFDITATNFLCLMIRVNSLEERGLYFYNLLKCEILNYQNVCYRFLFFFVEILNI